MQYKSQRRALIAINLALLGVLAFILGAPMATAQNAAQGPGRARGEYTLVSGKTNAGGAAAVYLLDSNNQELIAMRWDQAKQSLIGLGYRNIQADGNALPGR